VRTVEHEYRSGSGWEVPVANQISDDSDKHRERFDLAKRAKAKKKYMLTARSGDDISLKIVVRA